MDNLIKITILSIACGYFLARCVDQIKDFLKRRYYAKNFPALVKSSKISCSVHSWTDSTLVLKNLPVASYKVCTECGCIAGQSNAYLNEPGLLVLRNNIIRRKRSTERYLAYLQVKLDRSVDIFNKLNQEFYNKFSNDPSTNSDILKDFYFKAQLELDVMYSDLNKKLEQEENRG